MIFFTSSSYKLNDQFCALKCSVQSYGSNNTVIEKACEVSGEVNTASAPCIELSTGDHILSQKIVENGYQEVGK